MKPKLVQYEAPGWGVGELWLDGDRVLWSEHPRPRGTGPGTVPGHALARRLVAFFAGEPDDFADVELDVPDGFHGELTRALRAVPRGVVVTYGELAALAGRPTAARAAGTFCARVLRKVPRGEVVTYGELAALAGRPRAARAAGTFCARCDLAPFLPVHRVVSASGIGSWGDLGVDYKRRLLALEGVDL